MHTQNVNIRKKSREVFASCAGGRVDGHFSALITYTAGFGNIVIVFISAQNKNAFVHTHEKTHKYHIRCMHIIINVITRGGVDI